MNPHDSHVCYVTKNSILSFKKHQSICAKSEKKKKVQETPGEWLIFVKEGRVLKHDI